MSGDKTPFTSNNPKRKIDFRLKQLVVIDGPIYLQQACTVVISRTRKVMADIQKTKTRAEVSYKSLSSAESPGGTQWSSLGSSSYCLILDSLQILNRSSSEERKSAVRLKSSAQASS